MPNEHFLVTGAAGFIGAWVTHTLMGQGARVTAFDLSGDRRRLRYLMTGGQLAGVHFVQGDITNTDAVRQLVVEHSITHIIHLAALQVPFCQANPPQGARVNVVGTANVFEAAKAAGVSHLAYASSAAVYGVEAEYDAGPVSNDAPLLPRTLYGVYKQANEGMARVYWRDEGISSIGLRPYVVYGVGRDQGLTSTPTKAMLAAALGRPYEISYGGRFNMQYAADVARTFVQAARTPLEGAGAYNLRGAAPHMRDVVQAIAQARPEMAGQISFVDRPLPFPPDLDDRSLQEALGDVPHTPLADGVRQTVERFAQLAAQGLVGEADLE
ncbi:MAG: NAD-dependent epimerase/dehydratase family protein [bacterium]